MTEIPEGEFAEHPGEILRRVRDGEDVIVTVDGNPAVELHPYRRPVTLEEFLTWPKADRSMLDDIREVVGDETTDDMQDPWERWGNPQ